MTDPAVGQDDIRIENLPRLGVHTARPDGRPFIVVQPAYEVIAHILRVFIHVLFRRLVLIDNFDCVGDTHSLKGLVPK